MIPINVATLSAYCVRACKIKHFTAREFFLWRGNLAFSKREFPVAMLKISTHSYRLTSVPHLYVGVGVPNHRKSV